MVKLLTKITTGLLLLAPLSSSQYVPTVQNGSAPDAQTVCPGYKASHVVRTATGLTANLALAGQACNAYGKDVERLLLNVEYQEQHRLAVSIEPAHLSSHNMSWYILDEKLVRKPHSSRSMPKTDLKFTWGNSPSFWFSVIRKSSGDVLFSTKNSKIVFENQFVEVVTQLPQGWKISGMGEHMRGLALEPGFIATSWNTDTPDNIDTNLYGQHPFYMETRYSTSRSNGRRPAKASAAANHGVYMRNAHGAEAVFSDKSLNWRFIGGSIELYFFDGPSAMDITQQYTSAIGLPAMQQYWTLGYHQCRWGYKNWSDVQSNIETFKKHGIPLETQWVDIDYMQNFADFTLDGTNFAEDGAKQTMDLLHDNHQHFVPIIDAGIYYAGSQKNYSTYTRGHDLDVFLKNPDGTEYVGKVWPGVAVWPDWHHPAAGKWWADEFSVLHEKLSFDGIWIDMNEPSSFCQGSCGTASPQPDPAHASERDINDPPYKLNTVRGALDVGTVSPNATHVDGTVEYDVHNLFGYQVLNATYHGLSQVKPSARPFIIGRSTYAGSGQWAGHWGGDNHATWQDMALSIPQGLTFSMFGVPMFGVDACGFALNATEELCGRWMQLAAFFPFYRNHMGIDVERHEPWQWQSVTEYSREVMKIRYSLFPYFYTLMQNAHKTGSTVMRALSWEFPNDEALFGADRQFMVGPALMVTPVLTEGAKTVDGVFPGDQPWYDWYTQTKVPQTTANVTIDAPPGHIPLYIRGGNILLLQKPGMTVYESRRGSWEIIVALDSKGYAQGSLYLDDGESVNPQHTQTVYLEAKKNRLTMRVSGHYDFDGKPPPLSKITVLGTGNQATKAASFEGKVFSGAPHTKADSRAGKVEMTQLEGLTKDGAWSQNWSVTW